MAESTESAQAARKHVFVINGAPEFLNLMRKLFQAQRYNVTTTNFVPNSFHQIEALQPDVLIIDIVLGHQAGWALLERLHEEASTTGIPVLVVSIEDALLERARQQVDRYGGDAYLAKPFNIQQVLAEIDALIGAA
jgi:DNA-binding response OmpR family regulator